LFLLSRRNRLYAERLSFARWSLNVAGDQFYADRLGKRISVFNYHLNRGAAGKIDTGRQFLVCLHPQRT
jgi:hypothetical protein